MYKTMVYCSAKKYVRARIRDKVARRTLVALWDRRERAFCALIYYCLSCGRRRRVASLLEQWDECVGRKRRERDGVGLQQLRNRSPNPTFSVRNAVFLGVSRSTSPAGNGGNHRALQWHRKRERQSR